MRVTFDIFCFGGSWKFIYYNASHRGGSMAEWLGCRTCNPEVTGSSFSLTTKLELFLGGA